LRKEQLNLFFDNELPEKEWKEIDFHLEGCRKCRDTLAVIKSDADLTRSKLELLNPQHVPAGMFNPHKAPVRESGLLKRFKDTVKTSVRVPVPTFALLLALIVIMGVGLLLQNQKISKLKSPLMAAKKQTTLYLVSENRIQSVSVEADLAGFKPIKKPKIFVSKEKI
ncbi:MAG: hypothetical protein GY950_19310, partial [bacterium]|nr:hypothetical protein [bacterium]